MTRSAPSRRPSRSETVRDSAWWEVADRVWRWATQLLGAAWAYAEIRHAGPSDVYVLTLCAGMMGFPLVWGKR